MMARVVILLALVSTAVAAHYRRLTIFALSAPATFAVHQGEDFAIVYPSIAEAVSR